MPTKKITVFRGVGVLRVWLGLRPPNACSRILRGNLMITTFIAMINTNAVV